MGGVRVGKHFKIHTSIQNHHHTFGIFEDDALLAMYVRAGILAVERFADRTGDSFLISGMDLERLAGCRGVANARRKLGRLEATSRLTVGKEGAGYRVTFPNFAKKQGFGSRKPQTSATPSTSTSTSTSTSKKKKKVEAKPKVVQGGLDLGASAPPVAVGDSIPWERVCEAFSEYLPRDSRLTESEERRKRMRTMSRKLGATAPIDAIHGYAALHLSKPRAPGDWDPLRNFTPETVWRPSNVAKYLDADRAARDAGMTRPYTAGNAGPESQERDRFERMMRTMSGRSEVPNAAAG